MSVRAGAVVASTESSLFVWGGNVPSDVDANEPPLSDGAVFDGATGAWRPVASSPLPGGPAAGGWTGSEMVVSNAQSVATYDPLTDTWRRLQTPADATRLDHVVVLGDEVVFLPAGLAWNRLQDASRQLAQPPAFPYDPQISVMGNKVVVFGAGAEPSLAGHGYGIIYDPSADRWTKLPEAPMAQINPGVAANVVGSELVVVSWIDMTAAALDLDTLTWRKLPSFPQFVVICLGHLEGTTGDIVVVSMCGEHAALAPNSEHWIPFDPPSRSSFFDLFPHDGGLMIEGSVLDTSDPGWLASARLGPVTVAGLTIDRAAHPDQVTATNGVTLSLQLPATSCSVDIRQSDRDDVKTLAAAGQEAATSSPAMIEFWNPYADYTLRCPTTQSYADAIGNFTVRGERSSPIDATSTFRNLSAEARPEAMVDSASALIGDLLTKDGTPPVSLATSTPDGDPPKFTIEAYSHDDDATDGSIYTITLARSTDGWVVASATVQSLCSRGATLDDPSICV